ncbi:MAG TPA: transposase [Chromatiaceae bacterium]|nr:transposase [Chromatiaceae bacterium]
MQDHRLKTIDQLEAFLQGSEAVSFQLTNQGARYDWLRRTLVRFRYLGLGKRDKGIVLRYGQKVTGYSRQQVTRLAQQYKATGQIVAHYNACRRFARRYTDADIDRLVELDQLHNTPSGTVVKKLCERAYHVYDDARFERLATISVAHVYNLRHAKRYRRQRLTINGTRAVKAPHIGERRRPDPQGRPGFIRIDTVHQGDLDGVKGVYHLNAIDEVTQWQVAFAVEGLSEAYVLPALALLLAQFPFVIHGFHADNGSEFVNARVAALLQRLWISFTRSRPRHCNDNALAEGKHAATVRKWLGHSHIPQHFAPQINAFYTRHFIPYLNYHRPCHFPETLIDSKGKQRKRYRYTDMMTPCDKLISLVDTLPEAEQADVLTAGVTLRQLKQQALAMSDQEAAQRQQQALRALFETIWPARNKRA